jgi:hypothetical protein
MAKAIIVNQTIVKSLEEKAAEKASAIAVGLPVVNGKQALGLGRIVLPTGEILTAYDLEDGTQVKVDESGEIVTGAKQMVYRAASDELEEQA